MISGSLPGAAARPATQQDCDTVGGGNQMSGVGQAALMPIPLLLKSCLHPSLGTDIVLWFPRCVLSPCVNCRPL